MISENQLTTLKDSRRFPLISSIRHEIKEPIKHIYKELYTALEKYNEEGYYVTDDGDEEKGTFEVYFYNPIASGHTQKGKITLNPSDPSYKNKLASVVSLMVKKMYTIVIRQKFIRGQDVINVLYADQFGILDESYMKINFYGKQIVGTLQNNYYEDFYESKKERVQWKDSKTYRDLKEEDYKREAFTLKNSYPLWRFAETEDHTYNKIIARIFNEVAREDNIYPQLHPDDLP